MTGKKGPPPDPIPRAPQIALPSLGNEPPEEEPPEPEADPDFLFDPKKPGAAPPPSDDGFLEEDQSSRWLPAFIVTAILLPVLVGSIWFLFLQDPTPKDDPNVVLLRTGTPAERVGAVDAISTAPWATELLVKTLREDPDPTVRSQAWKAVQSRWTHHIGEPDSYVEVAFEVARWGGVDSKQAFQRLAENVDEPIRLKPLLEDPSPQTRQRAARTMAQIGIDAKKMRETQVYLQEARDQETDAPTQQVLDKALKRVAKARSVQQGVRVKGKLSGGNSPAAKTKKKKKN